MKAVVLRSHGGPEVLGIEEVPDPAPGPGEVLVKVVHSALNRADLLQRMGLYPGPPAEIEIPGLEYAGIIAGVGAGVSSWAEGNQVMGIVAGSAHAELLVTHERTVLEVPSAVELADASAIPEVFLTAYDALVIQGGLTSGGWALVHAGASGVGTAAIQIAKATGARIVVTTSSTKVEACKSLGADVVVDYTRTGDEASDYFNAVMEATNGVGVNVVLDVVGGEYTIKNLKSLAVGGRIIQVGVMGQAKVELPLGLLMAKRAAIIGTVLRARPLEEKALLSQRARRELLPRFEDGSLHPVIDSRFKLAEIADAHIHMAANKNVGKILIDL